MKSPTAGRPVPFAIKGSGALFFDDEQATRIYRHILEQNATPPILDATRALFYTAKWREIAPFLMFKGEKP